MYFCRAPRGWHFRRAAKQQLSKQKLCWQALRHWIAPLALDHMESIELGPNQEIKRSKCCMTFSKLQCPLLKAWRTSSHAKLSASLPKPSTLDSSAFTIFLVACWCLKGSGWREYGHHRNRFHTPIPPLHQKDDSR